MRGEACSWNQIFLGEEANAGHVYQPLSEFLPKVAEALEVERAELEGALAKLQAEREIFLTPLPDEDQAIYLAPYYYAECGVARIRPIRQTVP